ncbi:MAG: hypothetical protein ACRDC4_06895 [Plesiomonas sp.]
MVVVSTREGFKMSIKKVEIPDGSTHIFRRHKTFYRDSDEGVQYYHSKLKQWRRSFVFDSLGDYGLESITKQRNKGE